MPALHPTLFPRREEAEWREVIKRIGARLLVRDLASYKGGLSQG